MCVSRAGVIGLTTAVELAKRGYRVTVIAAHVPGDTDPEYTSPWAGAHWRTHASEHEPQLCDWDIQTYEFWCELARREAEDPRLPKSGVKASHIEVTEAACYATADHAML